MLVLSVGLEVRGPNLQNNAVALYFHRLGVAGGAQRMVCLLADALAGRNFLVHVVSWDQSGATAFYPLDAKVKWHRLGFYPGVADKLRRAGTLAKLLREQNVRVLVGFVMSGDRTVFVAAKLAATKLIAAERNAPAMYHMRYSRLERWLSFASLHVADRITVQFAEYVRDYPATLQNRIEVIPNPVEMPSQRARPEQPRPGGRFALLTVGRLDSVQKGMDKLVEAFAIVADRHPAWDLVIVGDGPAEADLRNLAVARGISGRVRLTGPIHNVFQQYVESNLFVLPSRWEGFPNALAEALAHGLPAVGFRDTPGVAQLIKHGETGWLADGSGDELALAKVLDEAMGSNPERANRGANASRSMAVYAPEPQFDRWASLIRAVAERPNE